MTWQPTTGEQNGMSFTPLLRAKVFSSISDTALQDISLVNPIRMEVMWSDHFKYCHLLIL